MTTIVTGYGKFKYNRLPMGMSNSADILQSKVDDLISDIKSIKRYINDILFLSKESLSKNIEQPRIIFGRFCAAGLKSMILSAVLG